MDMPAFLKKMTASNMVFMENQSYSSPYITNPFYQNAKLNNANVYDNNVSQNVEFKIKNDNIIANSSYGVFSINNGNIITSAGTHITNVDLNDLKTPGNYFTSNDTETNTLSNTPLQSERTLIGWSGSGHGRSRIIVIGIDIYDNNFIQQIFYSGNEIYQRFYNNDGWSAWFNKDASNPMVQSTERLFVSTADMDTLIKPGKYFIHDNGAYNGIPHTPESSQGNAVVYVIATKLDYDCRHQLLMCSSGNIYHRTLELNETGTAVSTIRDWYKITQSTVS